MSDEPGTSGIERRATKRRKGDPIRCLLDVPRESEVLYLSTGGMMVRLDFTPEIGSRHNFTLRFPERTLQLWGHVRNVEHLPGSAGEFRVGVEFHEVTTEDRGFLEEFVFERLP